MRWYFLWGLVASSLIMLVLFVLLILSLRRNWNHTNRSVFSYFIPLILVGAFIYISASQFVPRAFDAVQIVFGQYASSEVQLSEGDQKSNQIVIDGEVYFYPPSKLKQLEPGRYRIYHTERTNYLMKIIFLGETEDN